MNDDISAAPTWDEQRALANVDGYLQDLKDLLEIWLRQTPQLTSNLHLALTQGDAKKLRLAAHSLRGSLQILAAERAGATAEALELVGKSGELGPGGDLMAQLEQQLATLTAEVKSFLEQP